MMNERQPLIRVFCACLPPGGLAAIQSRPFTYANAYLLNTPLVYRRYTRLTQQHPYPPSIEIYTSSLLQLKELKHMPQPQEISVGPIDFKRYCDRTVPEYILLESFMNVFSDIHSEERLVGLWTRKVL
ncbi:hypothetical protein BKA57DRAFT_316657 [Linnemannia elongata]|nr:hypothetical protein BKA57DRAFT_316657 [Linnemannia elongata]